MSQDSRSIPIVCSTDLQEGDKKKQLAHREGRTRSLQITVTN